MIKQASQQLGSIGKAGASQIVQQPLEILKTAGQQLGGDLVQPNEGGIEGGMPQVQQTPTQPARPVAPPQPSALERNKNQILTARRQELDTEIKRQRNQRAQELQQRRQVEVQEEQKEEQKEQVKKESWLDKAKNLITGKAKRRVEARQPKAA